MARSWDTDEEILSKVLAQSPSLTSECSAERVTKLTSSGLQFGAQKEVAEGLKRGGVGLKALSQGILTTTPGGRLFFHMLAAIAWNAAENRYMLDVNEALGFYPILISRGFERTVDRNRAPDPPRESRPACFDAVTRRQLPTAPHVHAHADQDQVIGGDLTSRLRPNHSTLSDDGALVENGVADLRLLADLDISQDDDVVNHGARRDPHPRPQHRMPNRALDHTARRD